MTKTLLTVTQFAKKHGVSRQYVDQLMQADRIVATYPVPGGQKYVDTEKYPKLPRIYKKRKK